VHDYFPEGHLSRGLFSGGLMSLV